MCKTQFYASDQCITYFFAFEVCVKNARNVYTLYGLMHLWLVNKKEIKILDSYFLNGFKKACRFYHFWT